MKRREEENKKGKKKSIRIIWSYKNNNKIELNRNRKRIIKYYKKLQRKERDWELSLKEKLWRVEDRWKSASLSILHNLWTLISSKHRPALMEVFKQSKKRQEEMQNGQLSGIRILRNSKHWEININIIHSHKTIKIFRISCKSWDAMEEQTLLKMLEVESNRCLTKIF